MSIFLWRVKPETSVGIAGYQSGLKEILSKYHINMVPAKLTSFITVMNNLHDVMKHNLKSRKSRNQNCKMDVTYIEPCTPGIPTLYAPSNNWVLFEQQQKQKQNYKINDILWKIKEARHHVFKMQ
jgi:hypothetical protein